MTTRRDFLKRTSLALAAGLVLGDEALALYERLTHKKVWALGGLLPESTLPSLWNISGSTYEVWERVENGMYAGRREFKPDNPTSWGATISFLDSPVLPPNATLGRRRIS